MTMLLAVAACKPPRPNGKSTFTEEPPPRATKAPRAEDAIPPSTAEAYGKKNAPPAEPVAEAEPAPAPEEAKTIDVAAGEPEVAEPEAKLSKGEVMGLPYVQADYPNGLRAVAVRTEVPDVVSLQIAVRVGSRNEVEEGKSGFAHFFEHMMFRGTEAFPPEKYSAILKKAGANQNAYTSDDLTNYHMTFTKADLDAVLEVEADRFQNLAYTEDQFRTEALAVKGEYLKNYSNPIRKALEKLRTLAFRKHTYRHTTMGFFEDIEKMPDQQAYAKSFFERFYRPDNVVVLLVGDIEPEAALSAVGTRFGSWATTEYEEKIPPEPAAAGPAQAHITWESPTQPWLLLAFRGPAFDANAPTSAALDAVSTLAFSEASPLYRKLVIEEQLTDQLWAWFPKRRDPHLLHVAARLQKPEDGVKVRDAIYSALAELARHPLDASWVDRTKARLSYEMAAEFDDSSSAASTLASLVHFERTPETVDQLFASYAALTPADIQKAAKAFFTDQRRFMVTLDKTEGLPGFDGSATVAGTSTAAPRFFSGIVPTVTPPTVTTATVGATPKTKLLPSESSPLVTLSYVLSAGAAYDPRGKEGLAALTAEMIADAGSRTLSIGEINDAMYPMAASFDAQVDKEMIRFSGTVHRDNLAAFHSFASAQLTDPGFRVEDFERNQKKLINQIRTDLVTDNDEELAKEVLYTEIYGRTHPYGTYNLGTVESLERLSLEDVKAYYARHFRASGIIAGLAGGYPESFVDTVTANLRTLPAGEDEVLSLPAPPKLAGRRALIIEKKTAGVAVSAGFPISVKRGDPDWVALWLVRSWLGEHRSSNSHLYQQIREKRGMNYGDYAYIEYFPRGMFQFQPDANLARRQQIFQLWLRPFRNNGDAHFGTRLAVEELEKLLRDGLTQEQLDATRSYLQKYVSLLTQTQARQLGYAMDADAYGTGNFANYVREGLKALTLEKVNTAVRKHLRPGDLSFVFVTRDAASLLRRLGREMPSKIEYNTPKPELEKEDEAISTKALDIETITFQPVSEVF